MTSPTKGARTSGFWHDAFRPNSAGLSLKQWIERKNLNFLLETVGQPSGRRLLDVGCGQGHLMRIASQEGFKVSGVDASKPAVAELRSQGLDVFEGHLPRRFPLSGRRYDVVCLSHVLEHADTRSEAVLMIRKLKSLLDDGGFLMVSCPNYAAMKSYFFQFDYTHNFVTTPLRVRNMLSDQDLSIVAERRTTVGFSNPFLRVPLNLILNLTPDAVIDRVGQWFLPTFGRGTKSLAMETFSVIARKPARWNCHPDEPGLGAA